MMALLAQFFVNPYRRSSLRVLAAILFILFLLTTTVLMLRIGSFLPSDLDVIFISAKRPGFSAWDANGNWNDQAELEIFRADGVYGANIREDGSAGPFLSQDGRVLIAPGSSGSYEFHLKNDGNVPLDYLLNLSAKLKVAQTGEVIDYLPIKVRILRYDGSFVVGDEETWVPVTDLSDTDEGTLGAGRYASYTLLWRWAYEGGEDDVDTDVASRDGDVQLTLTLGTHAEESNRTDVQGGMPELDGDGNPVQIPGGGEIRWELFYLLLLLTLII